MSSVCKSLFLCGAVALVIDSPAFCDDAVCARVTLQINQQAVITRTVFKATLEIKNESPDLLEQLYVELDIRDVDNNAANERFAGLATPELTNVVNDNVTGGGIVTANSTAKAIWTLIPTDLAAPTPAPVTYRVGGRFSYVRNGVLANLPLFPVTIQVLPDAKLFLKYFLQNPVYSDNPFTLTTIEPAEPFSLGLLVRNEGYGLAKQMKITSSQPKIIRNDNQLVITFNIIGTQVGTQAIAPSLAVDFGDIPASGSAVARWLLTSSLQGRFISYDATFEHVNGLNNPALSLIESVQIMEMSHVIKMTGAGQDNLPDFLVTNRIPAPGTNQTPGCNNCASNAAEPGHDPCNDDVPDCIHSSDGTIVGANAILTGTFDSIPTSQNLLTNLTISTTHSGWNYIRVPDPSNGQLILAQVVRLVANQPGVPIPVGGPGDIVNTWTTHRYLPINGPPTSQEHRAHIVDNLDVAGTYQYLFTYVPNLAVQSILVNGGLTQRSNVASVALDFTAANNLAELIANGTIGQKVTLWLRGVGGGQETQVTLTADRFTWDPQTLRLSIDLTVDGPGPNKSTMLQNGNYELRLEAAAIRATFGGNALTDNDEVNDGIYRFGTRADQFFYRFAGDANSDRVVNELDEQAVRNSWLRSTGQPGFNANADVNVDGIVNFLDIQRVRSNWLNSLGF